MRTVTPAELDSANCSVTGCAKEGKQRRNAGALLCDEHYSAEMSRRSRGTGTSNGHVAVNGLVGQVKELEALARRLEKARQRAAPAVAELKAAQRNWDAVVGRAQREELLVRVSRLDLHLRGGMIGAS